MGIVDLEVFKRAIGETSAANDAKHQESLDDAESAVADHAGRNFGAPEVTEDREFQYDGSGFLEIDDASEVNQVTLLAPGGTPSTVLTVNQWIPHYEGVTRLVYTFLELPIRGISPEMGFMYNLDVFAAQFPRSAWVTARVNAKYGWPTVPKNVRRAIIWTAQDFEAATGGTGGQLTAKSVADVAESYAQQITSQQVVTEGVPPRAQALLEPFRRHSM